uniref:Thioredoxin n=1 Tax=Calcidiscus leptoporus TaxID=127549 RepID=A0A7S0IW23_9EUKA
MRKEMQDGSTPLVLDVFATWCGPCKLLAPQLDQLAAELGTACRFAKLDSDAEPQLSTELRVQGLPTLVFFQGGGAQLAEAHRVEGVPGNAAALRQLVQRHLGV